MTLKLSDVYVAQFALEGSLEAFDGKATGPLAGIGKWLGYRTLFADAGESKAGLALPWDSKAPHANLFWSNYVTKRMAEDNQDDRQADVAWSSLIPLKGTSALTAGDLHPRLTPAFSEAYAWPTALGFCRNYNIRGGVEPSELGDILAAAVAGQRRHDTLNAIREEFWGKTAAGEHSDVGTIVSVVRADPDSAPREKDREALAELLDGLDIKIRPRILPEEDEEGVKGAAVPEGEPGVYCGDDFRLIWLPRKFRASGRVHTIGCFNRNLVLGSLQARMIAVSALRLDALREDGVLPARYESTVDRLGECAARFWSSFHQAWFEGQKVRLARKALGI